MANLGEDLSRAEVDCKQPTFIQLRIVHEGRSVC